jgi:4-amino-4-deoxy-L-arabinose transferase-like glycosyltransferase
MGAQAIAALLPEEPRGRPRRLALEASLILGLTLALNLAGNGRIGLFDRDEPRYAVAVREMRASGDWMIPSFNGEPRYHKPILAYWLMGASTAVFGDNPFGVRLVSALAGSALCLGVWALARSAIGPHAGLVAALVMATAPLVFAESKLATTDATLALCLLGCQACLWVLHKGPSTRAAAAFWILLSLATLTKGPVGPAFLAAAGLATWAFGGPTAGWSRLQYRWGVATFLVLTAPWYILVGVVTRGDFYRFAVGTQVVRRMTTGMEEHGGFPGYYLVMVLGTFHPWSALLPAALLAAWTRRKGNPALGFLLGWAIGPWLMLECVRTKLVHYYYPALPACALLVAWLVELVGRDEVSLRRWPLGRLAMGLLGGVAMTGVVGLAAAAFVLPSALFLPLMLSAAVLAGGTLAALERFHTGATHRAVHALAISWALALFVTASWTLPAAEPFRMPLLVGERLGDLASKHKAEPILFSFQEPSIIYALRRPAAEALSRFALYDRVRSSGLAIAALTSKELSVLLKDTSLTVDVCEDLSGFNLNKGMSQTIHFALLRPGPSMALRDDPAVEQASVK